MCGLRKVRSIEVTHRYRPLHRSNTLRGVEGTTLTLAKARRTWQVGHIAPLEAVAYLVGASALTAAFLGVVEVREIVHRPTDPFVGPEL